jgi:hypothetical protein
LTDEDIIKKYQDEKQEELKEYCIDFLILYFCNKKLKINFNNNLIQNRFVCA